MSVIGGVAEQTASRMDVLNYGGESSARLRGALGRGVADAQNRATVLRDIQRRQESREAFRMNLQQKEGERRFNVGSAEDMKSRFGAGESSIDATTNKAKVPTSPEKKAVFEDAAKKIDSQVVIMQYLDILNSNESQAAHFRRLQRSVPQLSRMADFNALRNSALKLLASDQGFQDMFPEFSVIGNTQNKLQLVEDTLADGRLRARLSTRMQEMYEKVLELPKVTVDQDRVTKEADLKKATDAYNDQFDGLFRLLRAQGVVDLKVPPPPAVGRWYNLAANPDKLKDLIKLGVTPEHVATMVGQSVLNCNLDTFNEMKRYGSSLSEEARLSANIEAKVPVADRTAAGIRDWKRAHPADADVDALNKLGPWRTQMEAKYINGSQRDKDLYKEYEKRLKPLVDSPGATNLFETTAGGVKSAELDITRLNREITALPKKTADTKDSEQLRLVKESDLIYELEGIIGQSIADVMEGRYDEIMPLKEKQAEDEAKRAEEAGKLEKAQLLRRVTLTMQNRWVELRNGQRIKHKDAIRQDMMRIMYAPSKDEGVKQLLLEQMMVPFRINAADIANMDFDTGLDLRSPATNPRYILNADQLKRFNEIYEAKGQAYADKLFTDYFISRDAGDNALWQPNRAQSLKFNGAEWAMLQDKYGDEIDKGLEANQQARQTMARMREQGIVPDFGRRFMMYILFVLLGVGTGGVAGAGLGIATGAGALGVGLGAAAGSAVGGVGGLGASGVAGGAEDIGRNIVGNVQRNFT